MAAPPSRFLQARTSMVFRHGSLARCDKSSGSSPSASVAAAAAACGAAAGAAGASGGARGAVQNVRSSNAPLSSDMMQVEENGDDSGDMAADVVVTSNLNDTHGGSYPIRRVASTPGMRASPMFPTNEVSNAGGITMDLVHGGIRSKTPPTVVRLSAGGGGAFGIVQKQPGEQGDRHSDGGQDSSRGFGRIPSMCELTAAVARAAAAQPPRSQTEAIPSAAVAFDGVKDEREYRATSMADCWNPLRSDAGAQGPSKRAKSGAELLPKLSKADHLHHLGAFGAMGEGMGSGAGGFTSMDHDGRNALAFSTPTGTVTNMGDVARVDAARSGVSRAPAERTGVSGAFAGEGDNARSGTAASASPESGAHISFAGLGEPATNEAWLAALAPMVRGLPNDTHPEDFLHNILRERGYSTTMVPGKGSAFHRPPAPEQIAAYDKAILRAVLDEDEATLESMRSSGRRMDACNRFGVSVLHMACRRGRAGSLRYLLRVCGPAGLEHTDDFGRTVMHDACWTPTPRFDIASMVLDNDTRLLRILDKRGSSPLQYVPRDQWPQWCAFFESQKEVHWPPLAPGQEDVAGIIPLDGDASTNSQTSRV